MHWFALLPTGLKFRAKWSEFLFSSKHMYFLQSVIYPSKYGWTESLTLPPWKHFSVFCGIVTRSQNNISLHTLDEYNVRTGFMNITLELAYYVSTFCFRFQSRIVCSFLESWTEGEAMAGVSVQLISQIFGV